ncbi:hypothetical protein Agabi119p4_10372 [Agaricus bisporus var. burnettii]|uniref:Uncharacterized protein n=1 Tax=Agaricus bisporus var. burnettii TaxID=192524 RepID=A0A8H7C2E2_AGABI|nr:hypothetical protein Agabi119p4_10372 [Agaricus bisporus var. burnettii]
MILCSLESYLRGDSNGTVPAPNQPQHYKRQCYRTAFCNTARHPALVSRIAPTSVDVHGSRGEDGSVTDGDEVDRIVKHDVLRGGGGWNRILEHQSAVSTKRKERTEEMEYEPSKVPKLSDSDSGLIDLTMDSSNSEPDTHPGSSSDYFGLDDDDDELSRPCFKYAEGHGVDRKPARKPSSLGLDMAQESASEQMDKRH